MSRRFFSAFGVMFLTVMSAIAVPAKLGDLDEDGVPSVSDLSRILRHMDGTAPLSATSKPFADLNQDGAMDVLSFDARWFLQSLRITRNGLPA